MEVHVLVGESLLPLKQCPLRFLYAQFVGRAFVAPVSTSYWVGALGPEVGLHVWAAFKVRFMPAEIEQLDYYVRHRAVFTAARLTKFRPAESALCAVCRTEAEDLQHLFLRCPALTPFSLKLRRLLKGLMGQETLLHWEGRMGWEWGCFCLEWRQGASGRH